jgi:hypothetical protein
MKMDYRHYGNGLSSLWKWTIVIMENDYFQFGQVVFFGRSVDEYVAMFNLDLEAMIGKNILDCPAGPAAFAKQGAERAITVVACDPMYEQSDVNVLRGIVDNDSQNVARKQVLNRALFHPELPSTSIRREAMEVFLQDYNVGRVSGRYVPARLPELPFADQSFDMVLSANFLFIYSDTDSGGMLQNSPFDFAFHKEAIAELIRVCRKDVRIYPLRGPGEGVHDYLRPIMKELEDLSLNVTLQDVPQRDIIGAEQMMIISRP